MANQLKMAKIQSIQLLHSLRWSQRRIARELGIDRETVRKYCSGGSCGANPAIPPPGCEGSKPATIPGSPGSEPSGDGAAGTAECAAAPKPAIPPTGSDTTTPSPVPRKPTGRPSACAPYREIILTMLDQELTAQRIYQDLVAEHGFTARYDSVKRYVRKLSATRALPWRRIEVAPGVSVR